MPAAPLAAEFQPLAIPEFLREDLPNGMTLLVAEHHEQPALFLDMTIRAGTLHDPEGLEGLAGTVADMLREGTDIHSSSELAKELDALGGHYSFSAGAETSHIGFQVLSKVGHEALALLAESVRSPSFPKSEFRRVKQQQIAMMRASYSSPDFSGGRHFSALVYGNEENLGRFPSERSVSSIQLDDLRDFYQEHYHAGNAIMAVLGDCNAAEMIRELKEVFSDWPGRRPTREYRLSGDFHYRPERRFVIKRGLSQATILIGGRGQPSTSDERDPFMLGNHVLGASGFSSRLMEAVRSDEGKTYGIHSANSATLYTGTFSIQTFTRNEQVQETLALILRVVKEAVEKGLTQEELEKAKAALIGSFPLQFENPGHWSESVVNNLLHGRPLDYTAHFRERIAKIQLSEVNEVLKRILRPEKFSIVVVGDPVPLKAAIRELELFDLRGERNYW